MWLDTWLRRNPMTNQELGSKVGVGAEAARLYRAGRRIPTTKVATAICDLTQGLVTLKDLTEAYHNKGKIHGNQPVGHIHKT